MRRFCSRLGLDAGVVRDVEALVERALAEPAGGAPEVSPPSLVAGAIYTVCEARGLEVHKRDVAEACQTSVVTVSKVHRRLQLHLAGAPAAEAEAD